MNNCLTGIVWDEEQSNTDRIKVMLGLGSEGDGVSIFDDTGFVKKGNCSVGVAKQYTGTVGKLENCQVTVNCHYAIVFLLFRIELHHIHCKMYTPKPPYVCGAMEYRDSKYPQPGIKC